MLLYSRTRRGYNPQAVPSGAPGGTLPSGHAGRYSSSHYYIPAAVPSGMLPTEEARYPAGKLGDIQAVTVRRLGLVSESLRGLPRRRPWGSGHRPSR